jgi:imidazole glycerol-phosphate synthase subunit HisH
VIALLDYGAGNLTSVRKAFSVLGATVSTPRTPTELARAVAIVVPGVGHFDATQSLSTEWREAVLRSVRAGRPLLGICLGMQWLFEGSEEAPGVAGLGIIPGVCVRLPSRQGEVRVKVPHVGWNLLRATRQSALLAGIEDGAQVYFTHGYAATLTPATVAVTEHGAPFASAVESGGVWGVQFHPEKSGDVGLQVLRNFVARAAL